MSSSPPTRHTETRRPPAPDSPPPPRRPRPWMWLVAAAALVAVIGGLVWWSTWELPEAPPGELDAPPPPPAEEPDERPPETQPDEPEPDERPPATSDVLWRGDFGVAGSWQDAFGVVVANRDNSEVVAQGPAGRSDVLQITFGVGDDPRWGIDYRTSFDEMGLEERDEVRYAYDAYFEEDFEFIGDGKLGGLAGLTSDLEPLDTSSGGEYDERSWSVRAMWKQDRGVVMYLYARHADGRDFDHPDHYGFGIPVRFTLPDGSEQDVLTPGEWHRVEHRVVLNTPGSNDGIYELWIDGHRGVRVTDVQYRTSDHPDLQINQVFATWFFGGGPEQFPTRRNVAYTDNWVLRRH